MKLIIGTSFNNNLKEEMHFSKKRKKHIAPLKLSKTRIRRDDDFITISLLYTLVVCLVGFYGISTFVGYLTPNPFLYK